MHSCGNCLLAEARYVAKNNEPRYAHLCTMCWEDDKNREHFEKIVVKEKPVPVPPAIIDYPQDYVSEYPNELVEAAKGYFGARKSTAKVESGFLPISTNSYVASEQQIVVTTQPQVEMKLTRLIVPRSIAVNFDLRGIQVANWNKFAGFGEVSMEIFWGDDERPDIPPILLDYRLSPMHRLSLTIFNHSDRAQPFNATFITKNYIP